MIAAQRAVQGLSPPGTGAIVREKQNRHVSVSPAPGSASMMICWGGRDLTRPTGQAPDPGARKWRQEVAVSDGYSDSRIRHVPRH